MIRPVVKVTLTLGVAGTTVKVFVNGLFELQRMTVSFWVPGLITSLSDPQMSLSVGECTSNQSNLEENSTSKYQND